MKTLRSSVTPKKHKILTTAESSSMIPFLLRKGKKDTTSLLSHIGITKSPRTILKAEASSSKT